MAHLHAILAADSPTAILIKRGPGRCSCTIGWDRRTDSFALGQWLKQRIDHDAADISPDGQHFVYFVNTQKYGEEHSVYRAISRVPWLKALAFWSNRSWVMGPGPGMFFRAPDGVLKLWALAHKAEWNLLGIEVVADLPDSPPWNTMVSPSLFWKRLQRDGWTVATSVVQRANTTSAEPGPLEKNPPCMAFEKPLPHGWRLRRAEVKYSLREHNRPIGSHSFAIITPDGEIHDKPDWEWAEFDPVRNRLVWTAGCILFTAGVHPDGPGTANLLLNTKDMRFEPRQAPY